MKLTQRDMARILEVTQMTLRGFAFEDVVKKSKQNYEELQVLEDSFKS